MSDVKIVSAGARRAARRGSRWLGAWLARRSARAPGHAAGRRARAPPRRCANALGERGRHVLRAALEHEIGAICAPDARSVDLDLDEARARLQRRIEVVRARLAEARADGEHDVGPRRDVRRGRRVAAVPEHAERRGRALGEHALRLRRRDDRRARALGDRGDRRDRRRVARARAQDDERSLRSLERARGAVDRALVDRSATRRRRHERVEGDGLRRDVERQHEERRPAPARARRLERRARERGGARAVADLARERARALGHAEDVDLVAAALLQRAAPVLRARHLARDRDHRGAVGLRRAEARDRVRRARARRDQQARDAAARAREARRHERRARLVPRVDDAHVVAPA